jgi:hypothetical protein
MSEYRDAVERLTKLAINSGYSSETPATFLCEKIIKSIGDYCIERMKEEEEISRRIEKGNDDFRKAITTGHEPEKWWKNMRCPVHGRGVNGVEGCPAGDYAVRFACGCRFEMPS